MIYESVGAVCAVEPVRLPLQQFVNDLCVPRCRFALSNPLFTRASSSLMICGSLGGFCAVKSVCLPCQEFVDDL